MRNRLEIENVDTSVERRIAIALIVSTAFCREAIPIMDLSFFRNNYIKEISRWVKDYFERYEKAPLSEIEEIFEDHKINLTPEDAKIIEKLLKDLSSEYEQSEKFNVDYHLDKAEQYFKSRELSIRADNVAALIKKNKISEAEQEIVGYKEVSRASGDWIDPFTFINVRRVVERKENPFYIFPGAIGQLLGPMNRGHVYTFLAPRKRGKSFNLLDWAILTSMSGINTAFVSLEMGRDDTNERIYKNITAFGDNDKIYTFPCFDCFLNQTGECSLRERTNRIKLIDTEEEEPPEYNPNSKYRPCTFCRDNGVDGYEPSMWFTQEKKERLNIQNTWNEIEAYTLLFGGKLKIKCYPKFSANCKDIERDLDLLEYKENFVPSVIFIDYAGILKKEDPREQGRDAIDTTWKTIGQIAGRRHCLVFTAHQSTRASTKKVIMEEEDTSEDIRILGHVDGAIAINQTRKERLSNSFRLGLIHHRHKDNLDDSINVLVLQQLQLGQIHLDSMLVRVAKGRYIYKGF